MSKLRELTNKGYVALHVAPIEGSLQDKAGGTATITAGGGLKWGKTRQGQAIQLKTSAGTWGLSVADRAENRLNGSGTLVVSGDFSKFLLTQGRFISKRTAIGTNYDFYSSSDTSIGLYDGSASSTRTVTSGALARAKVVAVRFNGAGQKPEFFLDGVNMGVGTVANTVTSSNVPVYLGDYTNTSYANNASNHRFIVFNVDLSNEDIAKLSEELMTERGAGDPKTSNFKWLNNPINNEFTKDANWTKGTGWTIANGKATHATGTASDLEQADILRVGQDYTIEFKVSGRTAGTITAKAGTTAGTAQSADGVYTERLRCAGNTKIIFSADSTFVGSIDYVKVHAGTKLLYTSDSKKWLPTLADVTDGNISNTKFRRVTGTWSVGEDSTGKYLACVAGGQVKDATVKGADTSTTHTFTVSGSPTLTKNANDITIDAVAGEKIYDIALTLG